MYRIDVSPTESVEVPFDPGHEDVFVYYDGPMMFLADWNGGRHLFTQVEDVRGDQWVIIWLAAQVTELEEALLRDNQLEIRHVFKSARQKQLAFIWNANTPKNCWHIWLNQDQVLDDWLPEPGFTLYPKGD